MKTIFRNTLALASTLALLLPNLTQAQIVTSAFSAGDLIKGSGSAVYYFASDGRRYVFPNEKTYFTWYPDFSTVKIIPDGHLSSIPLGRSNVTYRPGKKMVKVTTDPKTYVVDRGGILRHVTSEGLARTLYDLNWKNQTDDLPDAFFTNYRIGTPIQTVSDYNPDDVTTLTSTIGSDKELEQNKITVTIGDVRNGFVPTTFTVKRGTTVTWTNRDIMAHTVTGSGWDSGTINRDQSYSRVFSTVGSFDYHCSIHPVMQSTINVVQ